MVAGVPLQRDLDLLASSDPSKDATLRNSDSFDALRCLTKSTMPPLYLKVTFVSGSVRSSVKRISRPLFKNAMICRRSMTVWARNSVSSKTVASGQKVTVVPVRGWPVLRSLGAGPVVGDLALELAALLELGLPVLAVAVHLEDRAGGQRVDHRHAHAVQAAGHLVALAPELAAGVQGGQHDLGRRLLGVLGVRADRDARPVVADPAAAVGQQGDVDPGGPARHGLVDRVVHDLPDQVVQAGRPGRADVHAGSLAHRLEALEDRDVGLAVGGVCPTQRFVHLYCHRRALSKQRSSRCVSNPRTEHLRPFDANAPFYPTGATIRHS